MDALIILALFILFAAAMENAWRNAERRAARELAEEWLDDVFEQHHLTPGHTCGLQPTCSGAINIRNH